MKQQYVATLYTESDLPADEVVKQMNKWFALKRCELPLGIIYVDFDIDEVYQPSK